MSSRAGVLDAAGVAALTGEFDTWIEQSRAQTANYGETLDGKARFDLEAGHTAERPRLRRVANPVDVSAAYRQALFDSPIPDRVAELIGPDVKFHHCKLNIKLPGMATRVDYHQDHAYDPHTNSDMLAMLLLDDMNQANDGLRVVPGSHRERYSHYRDGRFIGAIDPALDEDFEARSVPIEGERGDVCLMHTWTVHGGRAEPLGPAAPAVDLRLRGRRRLSPDSAGRALAAQRPHRAWQAGTQGPAGVRQHRAAPGLSGRLLLRFAGIGDQGSGIRKKSDCYPDT